MNHDTNDQASGATGRSSPPEDAAILARITELEQSARALEPASRIREQEMKKAVAYVEQYIESMATAKAYAGGTCERLRKMKVEEQGKAFDALMDIVRDEVDHVGINPSSGHNFAYIPGGGIWASAVADMLAAATNRYAGVYFASPGAVTVENQLIRWLCTLVGYPSSAHGNLSSGGSIANLIALQVARDASSINSGTVAKSVIYVTAHAHHCIHKAIHTTGLDDAVFRTAPMNSRYQMDPGALRTMLADDERAGLRPFVVVATAGTTDTGAIDPLEPIADLCAEHSAWFHVDAAYGGFFLLVDGLRERFKGIERSNSVVIDPHKGMFLPFGTGVVLVRRGDALLKSYSHEAPYMQDALGFDEISPADTGPELTKHFRGLRMWLPLHLHGVSPFRANLEEKVLLSRYFHASVRRLGFETGPEPDLSVSLFRYPAADREAFNRALLNSLQSDGRCFFSSTSIDGEFWIRCAVLNFRSHRAEVDAALQMIDRHARMLAGR